MTRSTPNSKITEARRVALSPFGVYGLGMRRKQILPCLALFLRSAEAQERDGPSQASFFRQRTIRAFGQEAREQGERLRRILAALLEHLREIEPGEEASRVARRTPSQMSSAEYVFAAWTASPRRRASFLAAVNICSGESTGSSAAFATAETRGTGARAGWGAGAILRAARTRRAAGSAGFWRGSLFRFGCG